MNKIDILVKLIALANNNPNENEANLAARKVCRLLIELKVNFKSTPSHNQPPNPYVRKDPNPQPQTWNDIKRSEEARWHSKKPTEPGEPFHYKEASYSREWAPKSKDNPTEDQIKDYQDFMRKFVMDWGKGAFNLNDEPEDRICMECHKSFSTKYRGPVPVCWSCRMVK